MSGASNGAPSAAPIALYLVSGKWLVGRNARGEHDVPVGACRLSPVFEYFGGVRVTDKGTQVARQVMPVSGLMSLCSLTVQPDAVVSLDELAVEERRDIERGFEACVSMVGSVRAEMAGVVTGPRLVIPGRS
jgi:hypothetical protein